MTKADEARLRHARYYLTVLDRLSEGYSEGGAAEAISELDDEWGQVESAQSWTSSREDNAAAELTTAYGREGIFLIDLYLLPAERVGWLEDAITAAERVGRDGDVAAHLMHIGIEAF